MSTRIRKITPNSTYLITRRCAHRQFLLQPSAIVNQLVSFLLAESAKRYGIKIHAFCFLSNHYHLVATDPDCNICLFVQRFHALIARSLNAHYKRRENFWSSEGASIVELIEAGDVVDKIVYTICNPVSSGLVRDSNLWPGARSSVNDIGTTTTVSRPTQFFRHDPASTDCKLNVEPPPGWTTQEFQAQLTGLVSEREESLRQTADDQGREFVGLRRLGKRTHREHASTVEAPRDLSPHFACKNPVRRVEEIAKRKLFLRSYREALKEFSNGVREVIFPYGTYLMRHLFGVCVSSP